jgi:predicted amidohydrolase
MPQRKVKIAIVQFESEHFDTAAQTFNANLFKMRGFIADASEAKANVVVFNEYFLGAGNLAYSSLEGEFEEDLISWAKGQHSEEPKLPLERS